MGFAHAHAGTTPWLSSTASGRRLWGAGALFAAFLGGSARAAGGWDLVPGDGIGVTILFSAIAAWNLSLVATYGLVWLSRRDRASLAFVVLAASTAGLAGFELAMAHTVSPERYALLGRWYQVPIFGAVVGLVGFVRWYLGEGRPWLAWLVLGLRTLCLVVNFTSPAANLNHLAVTAVTRASFLGEAVSAPVGVPNPWSILAQGALLLLLAYVVDAAIAAYRKGDRWRAVLVGGGVGIVPLAGAVLSVAIGWGHARILPVSSLFFSAAVTIMAFEMSRQVLAAARLSERLRRSDTRFRALFEQTGDYAFVLQPRPGGPVILAANEAACRMHGFSREELIGRPILALDQGHGPEQADALTKRVLSEGLVRFETVHRRKDGSSFPVEVVAKAISIEGEAPVIFSVERDVSERRELDAQRAELAHLSRVSTVGMLSAAIAHELNQPLMAILSNAQAGQRFLAAPDPDLAELREILQDIATQDLRAGAVIRSMRTLLKKDQPREERVDLNQVVETVDALLAGEGALRNVAVDCVLQPDLPILRGDRVRWQQVVLNLAMNAIESLSALPRGSGRVSIRTEVAGDRCVRIVVQDNGPGVPPDKLEDIFLPFFTTKGSGLGMGLAVSRSIVEAEGGRIWAENVPGGGARFTVELPPGEETGGTP